MKKILRLVTTSVLTLTLVACGEASSSVSTSGTTTSSSVSSVSSAYANVTTVTLSAASDTLTQVLGAQKRVTVTAALNANTNPNLSLEWFVNGTKSNQTGRIFEYVPTEVGAFVIQAKVGNVSSNNLTINVDLPALAVSKLEWATASQVLVTAPGGATLTVSGNELLDSSYYDLKKGQYVVNLKTAFTQGQTATLSLVREGDKTLTQTITYDTRKLELDTFKYGFDGDEAAVAAVGGVYTIVKPFDVNAGGDVFDKVYEIAIKDESIRSTTPVAFKFETAVPTGATAVTPINSLVVTNDSLTQTITVKSSSVAGLYTHTVTLGPKTFEVKVQVVNPTAKVEFEKLEASDDKMYDLLFDGNGVTAGADGVFSVTRPFETYGDDLYDIEFNLIATGFTKPEFVTNQAALAITGPSKFSTTPGSLFAGIETLNSSNGNVDELFSFSNFAGDVDETGGAATTSDLREILQSIDSGTPLGLYTFTVSFGTTGNTVSKEVKVRVIAPTPKLEFVLESYTSVAGGDQRNLEVVEGTNSITIEKPTFASATRSLSWLLLLSNYQSAEATQDEIAADSLRAAGDKLLFQGTNENEDETETLGGGVGSSSKFYKLVNYSLTVAGPQTGLIPNLTATKVGILLDDFTDGLVIRNNTDSPLDEEDVQVLSGYDSFSLDTSDEVEQLDVLAINSTTVPGTYTYTFTVDSLVRTLSINIVNPTQRVFVLNVESDEFATGTEKILVENNVGSDVLLAPKANGEYDIENLDDLVGFSATVGVSDLLSRTAGYSYNIVKTYPDGRVETITDVVRVTNNDNNLLSIFDSDNTKFTSNWEIDESSPAKGKYTFVFTLNGVTKTIVVNVIDGPSLSLGAVKLETTTLALHNSKYRVTLGDEGTLTVAATPVNLATTRYVNIVASGTGAADLTTPEDEEGDPIRVLVGTSGLVTLGELADGGVEGNVITITLTYWTAATGGTQLGDAQVITLERND